MKAALAVLLAAGAALVAPGLSESQVVVEDNGKVKTRVEVRADGRAAAPDALHAEVVAKLLGGAPDPVKVSVAARDVTLREALKMVFGSAKREYVVDTDVPDPKVAFEVHDVDLQTALNALTESAGVGYRLEGKDGKRLYRVTREKTRTHQLDLSLIAPRFVNGVRAMPVAPSDLPLVYSTRLSEERSVFICPHCKGQATTVKQRSAVRCPKCERPFQADWQFCPVDGAKRPAAAGAWKHCPFCGKSVG